MFGYLFRESRSVGAINAAYSEMVFRQFTHIVHPNYRETLKLHSAAFRFPVFNETGNVKARNLQSQIGHEDSPASRS